MKYCNKCGTEVKKDKKFCHSCGNLITERSKHYHKVEDKCPKCKSEITKNTVFCGECGHKLLDPKEVKKKLSHKIEPWHVPWIVIGSLLILAGGLLLPTRVVSYQVEVPYIDTETYTVEVPYEDVEEYTAQVPYETKEQYVESVPIQKEERIRYVGEWVKCSSSGLFSTGESTIKITNLDTQGGDFIVRIGYIDNSGDFIYDTQTKYIPPSVPVTFTYRSTPSSFDGCSYRVESVPVKTTTEYKDVIKERTVTKYREETKYRKVTRTRTETREREVRKIRNETRQKEVNWLFGFNAIIKFREL